MPRVRAKALESSVRSAACSGEPEARALAFLVLAVFKQGYAALPALSAQSRSRHQQRRWQHKPQCAHRPSLKAPFPPSNAAHLGHTPHLCSCVTARQRSLESAGALQECPVDRRQGLGRPARRSRQLLLHALLHPLAEVRVEHFAQQLPREPGDCSLQVGKAHRLQGGKARGAGRAQPIERGADCRRCEAAAGSGGQPWPPPRHGMPIRSSGQTDSSPLHVQRAPSPAHSDAGTHSPGSPAASTAASASSQFPTPRSTSFRGSSPAVCGIRSALAPAIIGPPSCPIKLVVLPAWAQTAARHLCLLHAAAPSTAPREEAETGQAMVAALAAHGARCGITSARQRGGAGRLPQQRRRLAQEEARQLGKSPRRHQLASGRKVQVSRERCQRQRHKQLDCRGCRHLKEAVAMPAARLCNSVRVAQHRRQGAARKGMGAF